MTGGPPVKVGDRIVALSVSGHNACSVYIGKPGVVYRVGADRLTVHFDEKPSDDSFGACNAVSSWRLADQPEPYRPEKGHRVRVVLEGEVIRIDESNDPGKQYFTLGGSEMTDVGWEGSEVVSIERLPDPELEWSDGDYVLDADGSVFFRVGSRWRLGGPLGYEGDHGRPARPLTLLVRDGKPVTGGAA